MSNEKTDPTDENRAPSEGENGRAATPSDDPELGDGRDEASRWDEPDSAAEDAHDGERREESAPDTEIHASRTDPDERDATEAAEAAEREATDRETTEATDWSATDRDAPEPVAEPAYLSEAAPVAAVAAARVEPEAEEPIEEEHGPSFASRALTFLLLLLAGAGLGLWAAPKIAPMLPAGMSGVAEWLTPGAAGSDDRIAALELRLDTDLSQVTARFAELEPADDVAATVDSSVSAAVTAARSDLQAEIAALDDRLSQIDPAQIGQRLSQIETAVDGQRAELASIKDQFSGGAAATSALSEQTGEQIDLYRAELEGLRAELGTQSGKVAELIARIDAVDAKAERQIETAQARVAEVEAKAATEVTIASAEADLSDVRAALAAGEPFADALQPLVDAGQITVPETLTTVAAAGVPTINRLRVEFPDAAHDAVQASIITSADENVMARTTAFLRAQVASRSLSPKEGADADAVLSRMEARLREDDLAAALAESEALPAEAAAAMAGWLDAARSRLAAEQALSDLTADISATN